MIRLDADDELPLSCTQGGSCCHGGQVPISPWELVLMAQAIGMGPAAFRQRHTLDGGTRLRFDGAPDGRMRPACGMYEDDKGCSIYSERPLACRLFPLARDRWDGRPRYYHAQPRLACYGNCPTVINQPHHSVAEFLARQEVGQGEHAHDAYAAMALGFVHGALALADQAGSGVHRVGLAAYARGLAGLDANGLAARIPAPWIDLLYAPEIAVPPEDPIAFIEAHAQMLSRELNARVGGPDGDPLALANLQLLLALHLGRAVGFQGEAIAELIARPRD